MWWSNDVVEAFSNAMTPTNSNSSRAALAMRLQLSRAGVMTGATLMPCGLEVRRVFHRQLGDRTFHIFFQVRTPCSRTAQGTQLDTLSRLPTPSSSHRRPYSPRN